MSSLAHDCAPSFDFDRLLAGADTSGHPATCDCPACMPELYEGCAEEGGRPCVPPLAFCGSEDGEDGDTLRLSFAAVELWAAVEGL